MGERHVFECARKDVLSGDKQSRCCLLAKEVPCRKRCRRELLSDKSVDETMNGVISACKAPYQHKPNNEMWKCLSHGDDINECKVNPDICGKGNKCTNIVGGYFCTCEPGYSATVDRSSCIDVDECQEDPRPCTIGVCRNTPGSFICLCGKGYYEGETECVDINECTKNQYICGLDGRCINTPGSYRCECPPGQVLDPVDGSCIDIGRHVCYHDKQIGINPVCKRSFSVNITRRNCCCTIGGAYLSKTCERCPTKGSPAYSVLCLRKVPPPITKIRPKMPPTTKPAGPLGVRTDFVTLGPSVTVYTDVTATGLRRVTGPTPTTPFIGIEFGALLTKVQGVFTSPNYPNPYPHGMKHDWIIQLPDSYKVVKITIKKMRLEKDRNCLFDYIIIKDKMLNQVGPRHCGTYRSPYQVPVRGSKAIITFVSDGSTSKAGFVIKYRGLQKD